MLRRMMMYGIKASASGAAGGGTTLNNGIAGAWKFENNLNDSFGTLNGIEDISIIYDTGKNGQCAVFSGVDYFSLENSPLMGTGSFSMFCWVKCSNTFGGYPGLFGCGATSNEQAVFLALTPGGNIIASLYGLATGLESEDRVDDGNWYHVGLVSDAGSFQLYRNGVANSTSQSFTYDLGADYAYFGKVYGSGNLLTGSMDDFYLWNRALSSGEISELYNSGSGKVYPFT